MNKRNSLLIILLTVPVVLVFSCQREKPDGTKAQLIGLWEWGFSTVNDTNS